jgi:hypothetical protein
MDAGTEIDGKGSGPDLMPLSLVFACELSPSLPCLSILVRIFSAAGRLRCLFPVYSANAPYVTICVLSKFQHQLASSRSCCPPLAASPEWDVQTSNLCLFPLGPQRRHNPLATTATL